MSLGFNWVDRVRSFWKILMRLHGTNFCINSTIFSPLCIHFRAVTKQCKMHPTLWNAPNHEFRVQWGGPGAFVAKKFPMRLHGTNFPLVAPVQPILHWDSCSNETFQMHPKLRNAPKHEFRVQLGGSGAFVAKNSNATSCHKLVH